MNVVITGGSKGIGYAIAEKLLSTDTISTLAICSRSKDEIEMASANLSSKHPTVRIIAQECDVAKEDDVRRFAEAVLQQCGHVDTLINNAGFGKFAPVDELSTAVWNEVLGTNLRGVFLMTHAFVGAMRTKGAGSIITIGSLAGKNGFVGGAAYCAAKYAVRGMMQSLFLEARKDDLRVVTIFPGSVDTHFFERAGFSPRKAQLALRPEDIAESVWTAISLPQHADISELDIRPTNPKG